MKIFIHATKVRGAAFTACFSTDGELRLDGDGFLGHGCWRWRVVDRFNAARCEKSTVKSIEYSDKERVVHRRGRVVYGTVLCRWYFIRASYMSNSVVVREGNSLQHCRGPLLLEFPTCPALSLLAVEYDNRLSSGSATYFSCQRRIHSIPPVTPMFLSAQMTGRCIINQSG